MKMEHMKKFFHEKRIFIIAAVILLLLAAIWLCILFAGQQDRQDASVLTANEKSSRLTVSSEQAIASEAVVKNQLCRRWSRHSCKQACGFCT